MPELVDFKATRDNSEQIRNDKMARVLMDAARRAKRGDFKSVAWFAWACDETAQFGWQKFGTIIPLAGAGFAMLQEMAASPCLNLSDLDDEPELPF